MLTNRCGTARFACWTVFKSLSSALYGFNMRMGLIFSLFMLFSIAQADDFKFNKEAAVLFAKSTLMQYLDQTKKSYAVLDETPIVVSGIDNYSTKIVMVIYPEEKNRKGNYHVVMYIKDGYFQTNSVGVSLQTPTEMKEHFLDGPILFGE